MPTEKGTSSGKSKSKVDDGKSKSKTSDDLLASLFNDLESTGQVDDLVQLINGSDSKKRDSSKLKSRHKSKDKSPVRDNGKSTNLDEKLKKKSHSKEEKLDSKEKKLHSKEEKLDSKEKKAKKEKKKKKSKEEKSKSKKDKSKSKKSTEDDEKVAKKKSRRSRSPSATKRKKSPSAKKRVSRSRSPVSRKRLHSPPSRKDRSVVRVDNGRFDWNGRHSRDNQGFLPWERDRWSRERSRSWSPNRYKRRRTRSPKPNKIDERRIDKKELLALARKNATKLAMEGRLPQGVELGTTLKNKSVHELIELCEDIQSRELELADPENVVVNKDEDYDRTDFSTAPVKSSSIKIKLKDGSNKNPKSNLERMIEDNALRKHFPVSFGDSHKGKTDQMTKEWMPVEIEAPEPAKEEGVIAALSKKTVKIPTAYTAYKPAENYKPPTKKEDPEPEEFVPFQLPTLPPIPEFPLFPIPFFQLPPVSQPFTGYEESSIIEAAYFPPPPPMTVSSFDNPASTMPEIKVPEPAPLTVVSNEEFIAQAQRVELEKQTEEVLSAVAKKNEVVAESTNAIAENASHEANNEEEIPMDIEKSPRDDGIASPTPPPPDFSLPEGAVLEKPVAPVSIAGLVSRRARLVQELNCDPDNHHKRLEISDIDLKLSIWAKVKNETTAHFGAALNMVSMVEARPINNSIWATKDTLRNAPEFKGGIGEHLLKKMGWYPGQGLGRHMDGPVEPLALDVKADRKGLYSTKDKHPPRREHAAVLGTNKNPVSVIMEYCAKQTIPPPLFLPTEDGTSNNRRFGCKAILNGVEYDSACGSTNKKAAKAQVALIMCQSLGLQ